MTRDSGQATREPLAIDGGPKTRAAALPVRKLFGAQERQAVIELMDRAAAEGSHVLAYGGEQERAYCGLFCEQMGGGHADGVNSGTNAVHVALAALELEPGSEVIVAPISDAGGVMPVALQGLVPVAADAEPGGLNTSAAEIERVLTERTRAVLLTHIAGLPVAMGPVLDLAKRRGLAVVEDCAQAHGATCRGEPVGTLGDIAAFSTMFGKHHATGGQGGVVYTRHEQLALRARRHADRGKPFGIEGATENVACALNCNMDELHAAIGRASLAKLPGFVAQRRTVAQRIAEGIAGLDAVRLLTGNPGDAPSYWFLPLMLDPDRLSVGRDRFAQAVTAEGIACAAGYPFFPMRMPWATARWPASDLPNARAAEARLCRIVIHEGWTEAEADDAARALRKVAQAYGSGSA